MGTKDKKRRKSTSCGGVIWRQREGSLELLLIKQFANKDRWGIPKGHQHRGETLTECALREIREETGVEVTLGERLVDVGTVYRDEDKTVVSYLSQPVNPHAEPSATGPDSEVADARWFPVSALPEIHIYQRPLITAAVERLFKLTQQAASPLLNGDDD